MSCKRGGLNILAWQFFCARCYCLVVAIMVVLAAGCAKSEDWTAEFAQDYVVSFEETVPVRVVLKDSPHCELAGVANFAPATDRVEVRFIEQVCGGGSKEVFRGVALDVGAELVGVRAECVRKQVTGSAIKREVCFSGRVKQGQTFLVLPTD